MTSDETRLAAIRQREQAATAGPWEYYFDSCARCDGEHDISGPPTGEHGRFDLQGDAEFIAHARTDIPYLLTQLDAQAQTIQTLRAALVGLVGVDGKADLEQMEAVMRLTPAPAADKAVTIDAIHALIATEAK